MHTLAAFLAACVITTLQCQLRDISNKRSYGPKMSASLSLVRQDNGGAVASSYACNSKLVDAGVSRPRRCWVVEIEGGSKSRGVTVIDQMQQSLK